MRPFIDAVPLPRLRRDPVEEQQALLLLLLHDVAVRESAGGRDLIELGLGVHLSRGACGERECRRDRKNPRSPHFAPGNMEETLRFATAGAVTLQLFAAPFTTRFTWSST